MIVAIIDNDTYVDPESVAGVNRWVSHATDHYSSDETIGTVIHLKSNTQFHIRNKTPGEVTQLLKLQTIHACKYCKGTGLSFTAEVAAPVLVPCEGNCQARKEIEQAYGIKKEGA